MIALFKKLSGPTEEERNARIHGMDAAALPAHRAALVRKMPRLNVAILTTMCAGLFLALAGAVTAVAVAALAVPGSLVAVGSLVGMSFLAHRIDRHARDVKREIKVVDQEARRRGDDEKRRDELARQLAFAEQQAKAFRERALRDAFERTVDDIHDGIATPLAIKSPLRLARKSV